MLWCGCRSESGSTGRLLSLHSAQVDHRHRQPWHSPKKQRRRQRLLGQLLRSNARPRSARLPVDNSSPPWSTHPTDTHRLLDGSQIPRRRRPQQSSPRAGATRLSRIGGGPCSARFLLPVCAGVRGNIDVAPLHRLCWGDARTGRLYVVVERSQCRDHRHRSFRYCHQFPHQVYR